VRKYYLRLLGRKKTPCIHRNGEKLETQSKGINTYGCPYQTGQKHMKQFKGSMQLLSGGSRNEGEKVTKVGKVGSSYLEGDEES